MPLMGSIYVGTSGLQTGQNALNTVAHNLSNMDTQGFVRQQILEADKTYRKLTYATPGSPAQQVGLGVTYDKVRQVRDYFLDQAYRRESGRSAFYDESYNAMTEVEDLLDELNDDASFQYSLNQFWSSLQELAKTPDDNVVQRMIVQNAQSFLTNASQVYQGLIDYQNELNAHIKEKVEEINKLGERILKLNNEIRAVEVGGIESANDLRDSRNKALDDLAGLVNIKYNEDIYGSVRVQVEGVDFVASDTVYKMNTVTDSKTGFYIPYWEIFAHAGTVEDGINVFRDTDVLVDISSARVFDLTQTISTEKNTDVGKLRAMLYIRGDKVANYTDIPRKPEEDYPDPANYGGNLSDPTYLADVKNYLAKMDKYEEDTLYYNETIAQSVCMNIQAEFDQLIHNIATEVNRVLAESANTTTGYLCEKGENGYYPIEMFQRISSGGYKYNNTTKSYEKEAEIEDGNHPETLYSIPNLMINPALLREAGKMGFVYADGTVDYNTAEALIEAFDKDIYSLNPNVTTKCSLNTYYTNLVSQVANSGAVYKNISASQQTTVDSISYSREQIQGVSSDEELTNMIKFQNAFNASSRYINVIDEMIEHIITQLG